MTPERKYTPASVFTVRLGFGSVILAAVITFIGLAWIFFLGVMVGRMYYGVDNTKQVQTPPTIQQSAKQENTIPHIASTTVPVQSKTGTTYSPVVKEDTSLEKITQAQDTYDNTSTIEKDTFKPLSLPSDVIPAANDENVIQNEKSTVQEKSVPDTSKQNTDFIEKVEENVSSPDEIARITEPNKETVTNTASKQEATEQVSTESSSAEMLRAKQEDNDTSDSTMQVIIADTNTATNTPRTSSVKEANNTVYICTYQLGTFTVADNASAAVEKLIDDGVNATVLSEKKNNSTLSYVFAYHTGTEASQQLVQEKFIKHGLANFIIRRKTVQ